MPESTALLTDRYELTMLESAIESGVATKRAYFEMFARSLYGRGYGVAAGAGRIPAALEAFVFDDGVLRYLRDNRITNRKTTDFLEAFHFSGSIHAYPDGEVYFPFSPIVRIDAPFAEGLILETLLLSIMNFDSAVATAASRMALAARGRSLIEMGSRRTNEAAAVAASRATYVAGFASTSNLQAGLSFGIPTAGTAGHALILAHPSEEEAFQAQQRTMGTATTALVDTYDIERGILQAVKVFGPDLGAIRIDSGDLATGARRARELLDSLGAGNTRIIVSGDLDEELILDLSSEPIDGFGVGTRVVTGSGVPTCGFVYKLAGIEQGGEVVPVSKRSEDKTSEGGRKAGYRQIEGGRSVAELSFDPDVEISLAKGGELRRLQQTIVDSGRILPPEPLSVSRARHLASVAELGEVDELLKATDPIHTCVYLGPGVPRRAGA